MPLAFNIVSFVSSIFEVFIQIFQQKKITISFSASVSVVEQEWNPEILAKEIITLLSFLFERIEEMTCLECSFEIDYTSDNSFGLVFKDIDLSAKEMRNCNQLLKVGKASKVGRKLVVSFDFNNDNTLKQESPSQISHYNIPPYYAAIRKKLKSHFSSIDSLEKMTSHRSLVDGVFIKSVHQFLEDNLENEDIEIQDLCQCLGVSRSQLYRKLTPLTKMTPAHYIRYFRLQKARDFLQTTTYTIGQVTSMVGFTSQSHFTRAFKEQFGINPSHFKKKKKE